MDDGYWPWRSLFLIILFMLFALIHGFSQDKDHKYHVSAQYIADWTGTSKRAVFNILKSLLDKGLIKKEEHYEYGIRLVDYYTVDLKELNK